MPRLAINGAGGRMGRRLVALSIADPDFELVAALESPAHPDLNKDAGLVAGADPAGIAISAAFTGEVDVVVDFSSPAGAQAAVELCRSRQLPLVLATTGLTPETDELVHRATREIAIVRAPSMSLAVNLTMKLAGQAAAALRTHPTGADVEIIERHHRFKEDAPSGTALRFGELIAREMGPSRPVHGRHGQTGRRLHEEIGYHAVRAGDNPGEHTIIFGLLGETIELTVRATSRDCYAAGALAAARFVVGQPAGLYSMNDVLGL